MGRYRHKRGRHGFRSSAVSHRQELTSTFGGIDEDVERLFLRFDRGKLEQLFARYEKDYGKPAATYARTAYPKWKDRSVKLSGQTAERLLNLVPPLLPFETRFELVKKLRNASFRSASEHIRTTPERWQQDLGPAIARVVSHGNTSSLSDYVKRRVSWLANGDVASTEKLLLAADQEEAINRLAYLNAEFIRIETMVVQLKNLETVVSHSIELPQGSIHVHIETPKVSTWQKLMNWLG